MPETCVFVTLLRVFGANPKGARSAASIQRLLDTQSAQRSPCGKRAVSLGRLARFFACCCRKARQSTRRQIADSARFSSGEWDWLFSQNFGAWKPKTFAELASVLPFRGSTWERIDALGTAFADAYWQKAWPWLHESTAADAQRAVDEFINRDRALVALECVYSTSFHKVPVTVDMVLKVLDAVRAALVRMSQDTAEEKPSGKLDVHQLVEVFRALQKSSSPTAEQRARGEVLEWFFLPILKQQGSPRLLLDRIRREPAEFVELLEASGWPENLPRDQRPEPTEQQKSLAQSAHGLLDCFAALPGIDEDGKLDEAKLTLWIKEARGLASEKGYRGSCERRIGQLLLHSPVDPAGYWPCAPVCRLLSEDGSEQMRDAFSMAIFNNQGWPGPFGNGMFMSSSSERQQAVEKLKELADQLDLEFPTVAHLLRHAAKRQVQVSRSFGDEDD